MQTNQKNLWIGDLDPNMDEPYLKELLNTLGYKQELANVKLIRQKSTGVSSKYGFLQFVSNQTAHNFYQSYNGRTMGDSQKVFRLNWATYANKKDQVLPKNLHYQNINISLQNKSQYYNSATQTNQKNLWIGDLDPNMDEPYLKELLNTLGYKQELTNIKLIRQKGTGVSSKYGFLQFVSNQTAHNFYQSYNGKNMGNSQKVFRLNWAAYANKKDPVEPKKDQVQPNNQLALRLGLYNQFYSMVNDPQLKAEYEKQISKTFGNDQDKKNQTLKQNLEKVPTLTYQQTQSSQKFLNYLPSNIQYRSKQKIQQRIYR